MVAGQLLRECFAPLQALRGVVLDFESWRDIFSCQPKALHFCILAYLCLFVFLLAFAFFTFRGREGGKGGAAEVVVVVATTKVAEKAMEIEEVAAVS